MNRDNLLKYLEALESGDFPQDPDGRNLKTSNGYCCLGVLEEVLGRAWEVVCTTLDNVTVYGSTGTKYTALPPREAVTDFLGLENGFSDPLDPCGTIAVTLDDGTETHVHYLNDIGTPFEEIARLIRKTYGLL